MRQRHDVIAAARTRPTVFAQQPAAAVQLVNPEDYDGRDRSIVASRHDEMGSHGYHLNAWVANPPANPVVQFLRNGSTIGTATRRGDAFEFFWVIPGAVDDDDHTLTARLFDAGTEPATPVAEDTVEVEIDREAAGVRIDYPTNEAQAWGLFAPPGTADFNGIVDVFFNSGTERIEVFYSTSAPGTEPVALRDELERLAARLLVDLTIE
jgi:hypothetical protein